MSVDLIDELAKKLAKLPGLGPRSARRAVLHLLSHQDEQMQPLIELMQRTSAAVQQCEVCGNFDVTPICSICNNDHRKDHKICIVEQVADLWALERSNAFNGKYHVLGGVLSAIDGITPVDLGIPKLIDRVAAIEKTAEEVEVIVALSATMEGQITGHYIAEQCERFSHVKLSKLAHGIPLGSALDYLDDGTLAAALDARRHIDNQERRQNS